VTVTGTSLEGATIVMFGFVPATSYTVNAAGTKIIAFAPAQTAGSVDIVVTGPGGSSPTGPADVFTYP
jgi:hypothetical protein